MFRVLLRHEKLSYCQPPHKPDSKEDLRVHVGQGEEGEDASGQGGVPEQGQGVPWLVFQLFAFGLVSPG